MVTQERSKVLKETENPFGGEDDDSPSTSQTPASPGHRSSGSNSQIPQVQSFSHVRKDSESKKKKDKKDKKRKPFNLEAEREEMKASIAESSIAATDLSNTLQSINRDESVSPRIRWLCSASKPASNFAGRFSDT